jgi:hypothetical protein
MRMLREENSESKGYIGVFHCGKSFRYSKKETVVEREEKKIVLEKRDPCVVLHITPYRERKEKEKDPQYSLVEEGIPYHIKIYVEPMTLCVSPRFEAETITLSR